MAGISLLEARNRMFMASPHIETVTGDTVNFNTDVRSRLKSCKLNFRPIQGGGGVPSPSNVRSISGWTGAGIGLPEGYQEVEYIQNNSTAYINTGYVPYGDETFSIDFSITALPSSSRWIKLFGHRKDAVVTSNYNCWIGINGNVLYSRFGTVNVTNPITMTTGEHSIQVDTVNGVLTVDGTTYSFSGTEISGITDPLYFSDAYRTSTLTTAGVVNYKNFKIYRGGNLVLNYIPCSRNSDDAVGMYDTVSNQFITNNGTATFIKGIDDTSVCASADWTNSVGTLYGGYIDLVTGELVATHGLFETTWGAGDSAITIGDYVCKRFSVSGTATRTTEGDQRCNVAYWLADDSTESSHYYTSNNYAYLTLSSETSDDLEIQFALELSASLSYQVSSQQIIAERGTNSFWGNSNDGILIKYWTH